MRTSNHFKFRPFVCRLQNFICVSWPAMICGAVELRQLGGGEQGAYTHKHFAYTHPHSHPFTLLHTQPNTLPLAVMARGTFRPCQLFFKTFLEVRWRSGRVT